MAKGVVVDTDVVSQLWRKRLPTPVRALLTEKLYVSYITVGEVWQGIADAPHWPEEEALRLAKFLRRFNLLVGDRTVARRWGLLSSEARRRGQTLPVNDSWIAATCLARNLPLVTLNRKDFERVPGLRLLSPTRAGEESAR